MKRVIATAVLVIVGLTGCAQKCTTPKAPRPKATVTVTVAPIPTETPDFTKQEGLVKYGQTYRWGEWDFEAVVAKPVAVTPKNTAGQRFKQYLEFTITMTNLSKYAWTDVSKPVLIQAYSLDQPGVPFSGHSPMEIAGGKSVTFKLVFGVANPETSVLAIELMPDFVAPITWG